VRSIGNKKLLSSYLWIYDNRTSYKLVVPRSKDGGCTRPRGCDTGDLVGRVFDDRSIGSFRELFHVCNNREFDNMITSTYYS
jgi:hypothetical protein